MNIKSFIIFLSLFAGLFLSVASFGADSKKTPPPKILTMPLSIQQQICQRLLNSKGGCTPDVQIIYNYGFKMDNDKNLLFFHLKDKNNRYSFINNISVSLDSKGKWKVGQLFTGVPEHVVRDYGRGLWLHTQYNVEGQLPQIFYSKDGYVWKDIELPAKPKSIFMYEYISRFCISSKELLIAMHGMGMEDDSIWTYWKAPVAGLATSARAKQWRSATSKLVKASRCSSAPVKNNQWLIQDGETMTLMIHPKKHLTVKIVHDLVTKKPVKQVKPIKQVVASKVVAIKNFAVQIAAYKNMSAAHEVTQQLQKNGFHTFTRVLDSKSGKIKKIYIGPYGSREIATEKQKALKVSFKASNLFQSAFVLKFR